tara:strand:- start:1482 stop:1796 length:315 start_codon:yes stop_codon:yes gene_type:complete
MASPTFMNVVRFKLKPESVAEYFEVHRKFVCKCLTDRYIAKTGEDSYCFVGLWESEKALIIAKPKMLAYLNEVREFMRELSPELGVTDPVSGTIIAYEAEKLGY